MCSAVPCKDVPVNWGQMVARERDRRGWTRAYVAELVDSSDSQIKYLEDKTEPPKRSKVAGRLLALYGLSEDVDESLNPRLLEANKLQLVERLARIIADEEAQYERHDQSNVTSATWRFRGAPTDVEAEPRTESGGDISALFDREQGDDPTADDHN